LTEPRRQKTRATICQAFAEVLAESETGEFSMQEVADRANVTHRTVYNHFPSREALMDGLVEYQEDRALLLPSEDRPLSPESGMLSVEGFPSTVATVYRALVRDEAANRAFARLSVSARRPPSSTRERTARLASALGEELNLADSDARRLAAAVRLFGSQVGWHLLTQHYDLPNHEAAATAQWAVRVLLKAAAEGDLPKLGDSDDDD
jgi:AcrR family transcriptional regulator